MEHFLSEFKNIQLNGKIVELKERILMSDFMITKGLISCGRLRISLGWMKEHL
jgi:hypothetical protein